MTSLLLSALVFLGCSSETGFGNAGDTVEKMYGNGQIEYTPTSLDFSDLDVGVARSQYLKVTSVGEEQLVIYEIRVFDSADGVFYMEEDQDVILAPGQYKEYPVTATLQTAESFEGSIRIECNDLESTTFYVDLLATPVGAGPSDTATGETGL